MSTLKIFKTDCSRNGRRWSQHVKQKTIAVAFLTHKGDYRAMLEREEYTISVLNY